jgi:NAD(P)-dependent dehydrogenase (short-subunit alcohol dehydrogenase family)
MSEKWTTEEMPDQSGRTVVVTGSNTGIGYETAMAFAGRGAEVVLAVRNVEKGRAAVERIRTLQPRATVTVQCLDLSSLESIRTAAEELQRNHSRLDVLVNNAGIAHAPRGRTEDGFERIFGTNHLGHFALTGLMFPLMLGTPGSRVVTVSALAHQQVRGIRFDDLRREESYNQWQVYGESKLANLLFTSELQRRLIGTDVTAVAAHPGLSRSDLSRDLPRVRGALFRAFERVFLQSTAMGALPSLRAATDSQLHGGEYLGPRRRGIRGYPVISDPSPAARNEQDSQRLWSISEELTSVRFPI